MSWSTVLAGIDFWSTTTQWAIPNNFPISSFSTSDKNSILGYLENLYNNSNTAKSILDDGVAGSSRIRIGYADLGPGASIPSSAGIDSFVVFDLAAIDDFYYFNNKGELIKEIHELTVIHELIHNIRGLSDVTGTGPNSSVTESDMQAV